MPPADRAASSAQARSPDNHLRLGTLWAALRSIWIGRLGLYVDHGQYDPLAGPAYRRADRDGPRRQFGYVGEAHLGAVRHGGRRARRVWITSIAALIDRVAAWSQLDSVISAVAAPADRQPNIVDIRCDRLLNDDCHPWRRTDLRTSSLHRATASEQQEKQLGTSYERSGFVMRH